MSKARTTVAHPDELDIGQDKSITLDSGMSRDDISDHFSGIETVDTPNFKEHADNLLFNEEIVAVYVFPSSEKNAEQIVEVFNDGIPQRFLRGQWQNVKRKFVEVLARAKPFTVTTPQAMDSDNNRTTRIDTFTGLRYPFEMRDTNPRGAAWLSGILQEG